MSMITDPVSAPAYLLRGWRLIQQPGLRRYALAPLAINLLVFATATALAIWQFNRVIAWSQSQLPQWLDWLAWLLWPVFIVAVVLIFAYTFTLLANLIAAPFNSVLAARVEARLSGTSPQGPERGLVREAGVAVVNECRKLGYFAVRALPLFVLMLIPGLGVLAAPLWLLLSAWFLGMEYLDYPMGNHGFSFPQVRAAARQAPLAVLGFGSLILLVTTLPLANLVVMPAAVAGATQLWVDRLRPSAGQQARAER